MRINGYKEQYTAAVMNICQRINHNFALSPSGKAQDFDSCIRWFESNKGSSAYFLLTVYLCNQDGPPFNIYLFGFIQLRVVQDYPRGFASHRGVKFNLSRIFLNTPDYLLQNSWQPLQAAYAVCPVGRGSSLENCLGVKTSGVRFPDTAFSHVNRKEK